MWERNERKIKGSRSGNMTVELQKIHEFRRASGKRWEESQPEQNKKICRSVKRRLQEILIEKKKKKKKKKRTKDLEIL